MKKPALTDRNKGQILNYRFAVSVSVFEFSVPGIAAYAVADLYTVKAEAGIENGEWNYERGKSVCEINCRSSSHWMTANEYSFGKIVIFDVKTGTKQVHGCQMGVKIFV